MSRYIRTKDGKIYDTEKCAYTWTTPKFIGLGISVTENILIPKSLIERQADSLEEICDVLVVCDPQLLLPFIREKIGGDLYLHPSFEEEFREGKLEAVYGSIWVDGNLMKVAEMNEKGDLELL